MGHLKKFPSKKKKQRITKCLEAINNKRKIAKLNKANGTSGDGQSSIADNPCPPPAITTRQAEDRNSAEQQFEENHLANCMLQQISGVEGKQCVTISGRRIVNIADIFIQIKQLDNHSPFGCTFVNIEIVSEKRVGIKSGFGVKCNMCSYTSTLWTEIKNNKLMDVNTGAVCGTVTTGGGHAQLEEFLSVLDIPPMSQKTFKTYEEKVSAGWTATALVEMEAAAAEEARLARENGELDKDGTPFITVVADGAWCKRSYRTNYSSLSGVAAIVGYRTRKVIFLGVRNKYCTTCARAEGKSDTAKPHTCYKNWGMKQSSTSMEAAIICEGFKRSEEMYQIRYTRLIADGDSSVYKKILESRPYKHVTVEKVECTNHLLRNMCTRMKAVACSKTQKSSVFLRKKIGENILRCRVAVTKAKEHRKTENRPINEKIDCLRQDILNIPSHIFGEHKQCKERGYFCEQDPTTAPATGNLVSQLASVGLYPAITEVFKDLSRHSRSLLIGVTSNYVEHFNSIVAKFVGGKRINFALSGSYQGRCTAAVVQHNSGQAHYQFHKAVYKSSPGTFAKSNQMKRKRKMDQKRNSKRCRKSLFVNNEKEEIDYGLNAQRPDIDEKTMERESEEFMASLKKTDEERHRIERETILQSDSSEWLELRRSLLTASHFGRVCKMRLTTGCESLVKQILYTVVDCEAMKYGRTNEETARVDLEKEIGEKVQKCGIFIDSEYPFLGGSPDGLVNEIATVEIKCPSSAKELTPEDAIKTRKCTFWTVDKKGKVGDINRNHNFYYQIQGQLRVTRRQFCYFTLWTPKGIKIAKVDRDNEFWKEKMFPKLERFYKDCLLPEIVDPRHNRSMPIRNPLYIEEAKSKADNKKKTKGAGKSMCKAHEPDAECL